MRLIVCLIATSAVFIGSGAEAQTPDAIVITDRVDCSKCSVSLEKLATLGVEEGPGALASEPVFLVKDSRGNHYLSQYQESSEILIYDRRGVFVGTIGRSGRGPGEFRQIGAAYIGSGDTLVVFDVGNARYSIFDPNRRHVKDVPLLDAMVQRATPLGDGAILVNALVPTQERIGIALHILSGDRIAKSLDDGMAHYRADAPHLTQRVLARSARGFWTAPRTQYAVTLWDEDGRPASNMVRRAAWFEPYLLREAPTPDHPPKPWIMGIAELSSGLVAALVSVPSPTFAKDLPIREVTPHGPRYDLSIRQKLLDTIVEVLDPENARLIMTVRLDEYIMGFISPDEIYSYRVTEEGHPFIDVWRIHFNMEEAS